MICYTRNFEDVILQRVLADVEQGVYVDVGASYPVRDSNTYALYQKGWRGVALEPLPYLAAWQQARPDDIFLNAAAGCEPGSVELSVYGMCEQLTTGSSETVSHLRTTGMTPHRNISAPVLTLDEVIADHLAGKPLHLLSIDVEGMESEVLAGLDLSVHRPWVMIIEATRPRTQIPAHDKWEPALLAAGYLFAYFDGVNRFYLAQEQQHLFSRFALPPNVFDQFITAAQIDLLEQVARLRRQGTVRAG